MPRRDCRRRRNRARNSCHLDEKRLQITILDVIDMNTDHKFAEILTLTNMFKHLEKCLSRTSDPGRLLLSKLLLWQQGHSLDLELFLGRNIGTTIERRG